MKIANYKRSKDPETQWFTYSWKFEEAELIKQINEECEKELNELNARPCEIQFRRSVRRRVPVCLL